MKNRFYSRHPLILSLLLLCFAHFSFVQKGIQTPDFEGKKVKNVAGQSAELCLQDSVFVPGQLLGLNATAPWIGDVFNVSSDLSTVTNDSTFVVPPIQIPDPSTGFNDTIDYYAIDYNPVDGLYYLLADNSAGGINLYSVDITTAATIDLGFIAHNDIFLPIVLGMTFDNSGNLYFAILYEFLDPPFYANLMVIPAEMLTDPVPAPMFLGVISVYVLTESFKSMSYNFDDNTIYYAAESQLYELDLSGNIVNGPIDYTAPGGCDGQTIEYVGNGILYGGSCIQIYQIDPTTGGTYSLATYSGNFTDLLFVPPTSTSIELTGFEADFIVDVFPNPTNDELTILFETINSDDINFKLTDILGRTIMEENITPNIGLNTKVIDLSQLTAAVYFVVMDNGRAVRKVVRE